MSEVSVVGEEEHQVQSQALNTSASGNLSFELLFSPANSLRSSRLNQRGNSGTPNTLNCSGKSLEEINEKLQAAGQRRQDFESQRAKKASTDEKIAVAAVRRGEIEKTYKEFAEKDLQVKLDVNKENREKFIEERLEKIKEHEKRVEAVVQRKCSKELEMLERDIEEKQRRAQLLRNQKISDLKEKLQKQEMHVQQVLSKQREAQELEKDLYDKRLKDAIERRDEILEEIKDKQREHDAHVKAVRSNKDNGTETD